MLYLTCTTITSIDLAHYGVSRAKDWVSVKCGTNHFVVIGNMRNCDTGYDRGIGVYDM